MSKDKCKHCEVLKNKEKDEKTFLFGFFCPIKDSFTLRDDEACEWIVGDNLPF